MKILFINAIDPTKPLQTSSPPLGIGHMISSLRERFGEDTIEFKVVNGGLRAAIEEFGPDIIGISSVSQNFNLAIAYAQIAKAYGIPVICGGVHISMMPSSLTDDMDVGVIGEGEKTIYDLVQAFILDGGVFAPETLQFIPGIIYHDNGRLVSTGKRRPVECLDSLPPPAREFFPIKQSTYMFTSRGCPFQCTFCSSTRFWEGVRLFSPTYIATEIQRLVEQGVNDISFYDDIFPLNADRIRGLISALRNRGLLGKVDFHCSIRANMVTDEIISLLRDMGVKSMGLGLESGCWRTLRFLKGDGISIQDNAYAIKTIRRYGIKVYGSFIIGSPDETKRNALETLRFVKDHRLPSSLYLLTPFPGTPIWDYALSKGLVSEDMDWSRLDVEYSGQDYAVILSERMTKRQLDSLFYWFERSQVKIKRGAALNSLVKTGLHHPSRIPGYVGRRIIRGVGGVR